MRQLQLDGVRGLGVLIVIAAHHRLITDQFFFTNGWPFVDLFFALSGFLITRVLIQTRDHAHYWKQFYIKRAGRILPALLIVLAIVPFFLPHPHPRAILGYTFFLGNWVDITTYRVDLWIVLWSLAIEEHFYLLWPLAVKRFTPRNLIHLCLGLIIVAPILRFIATPYMVSWEPIYYLTWFRMDAIAAGSLLALLPLYPGIGPAIDRTIRRWSVPCFLVTLQTFMTLAVLFPKAFTREANDRLYNTTAYSLSAIACFFLCAHLVSSNTSLISRVFALRPFVFLGEISYGLYLYHMIINYITRRTFFQSLDVVPRVQHLMWLDLAITIPLAWLSYRYIELPIIDWSRDQARRFRHPTAPQPHATPTPNANANALPA